MAPLTIRRFDPAVDDYGPMSALWTRCHPDLPRDPGIWRGRDEQGAKDQAPHGRYLALRGDDLVGAATYDDCPVAGEPGQLQVSFAVPAGEYADEILEALVTGFRAEVEAHAPPLLIGYARDTEPHMGAFFLRHDFAEVQRTHSTVYRPRGGEAARLAEAVALCEEAGYDILSVRELGGDDAAWMRPYHAMEVAVVRDIPFSGPVHVEPFEKFEQRVADASRFHRDTTFVARERESGELAGVSLLSTFPEIPGYAFAGLTGVVRAHRRRGIARVLKLATMRYAAENEIDRIVTLNEENNPMLALNLDLGFEVQHVQMTFEKRLDG